MHFNINYIHSSFSFVAIWNLIKGNIVNRSRVVTGFLWLVLFLCIVYVLVQWHSVPTYTHYIYLDRMYSERPPLLYQATENKDDYYVSADYKLYLSSGAAAFQNEKTIRFREELQFIHELSSPAIERHYKNRKEWSSIWLKNHEPKDFNDVLSPELSKQAMSECAKKGLQFSDFKCGYFYLHRYQDDISRYNAQLERVNTINSETDTVNEYAMVSKRFEREYLGKILEGNLFVQEKEMPNLPNAQFTGECQFVDLSNSGIAFCSSELKTTHQSKFYNFVRSLFYMYDLTKAKYKIYLSSNAIDSVNYKIIFEEGVSFSDINVNPDHKDMNSLTFRVADGKRNFELSEGIIFFVEFLESSNIQLLRVLFLGGICCVPFIKTVGKICSIFTVSNGQTPPPAIPEPKQEALSSRPRQRNGAKKKK